MKLLRFLSVTIQHLRLLSNSKKKAGNMFVVKYDQQNIVLLNLYLSFIH